MLAVAVSCLGNTGGGADVPVLADGPNAGVTGVRAPSTGSGGTLRVVAGEVDSLDPQRSYLPGVWNLMRLYTRTLVSYGTRPGATDELVPDLATDLGRVSKDGLTWTFTLRKGARFETGAPITSRDLKYGIERSFASDVIVGGPTHVVDLLDVPGNQYAGPYQDSTRGRLGLKTIQTPDDSTIVFHLRTPQPDLPFVMALPSSSPVPAARDTRATYGQHPVSSGPYVVTSVDPIAGIVLDRNKQWSRAADPIRTALPDRVVVRTGLSGLDRDQALLAGSADVDISGTGVQAATTARMVSESSPLHKRSDDVTTGAVRLLALPSTVGPMRDPHCRAAVADVIDRGAVQKLLGGAPAAVQVSQLWPGGVRGGPAGIGRGPDLAAARTALQACGKPGGFSTALAVADLPANVALAEALREQLGRIGITATVKALDAATFYASDIGDPKNVTVRGYGIVLTTWTADFPTPDSFLAPLVDGRGIRSVGNTDYADVTDKAIEAQIDAARAAGNGDAALAHWRAVAAAAQRTSSYVPLAEMRVQLLAGERLRTGVAMQPYRGYDLATAGLR
jgi:peptide/nickel transport system substrate-binding protein